MTLHYSRGRNINDNHPTQRRAENFGAFVAALDNDRAARKDGAGYICGPLNGDGRRSSEGALPRSWLALDADKIDADTLPEFRMWFMTFSGCGWPTHSSKPDAPRERVVIELDREATRAECIEVGRVLAHDLANEFGAAVLLDASTHRPEQPVFLPPTGVQLARFEGEPLQVDRYLQAAQDLPRVQHQTDPHTGEIVGKIAAGGRHEHLVKWAAQLNWRGVPRDAVMVAVQAENLRICEPPKTELEVQGIVGDILKRYSADHGRDLQRQEQGEAHAALDWGPLEALPDPADPTPEPFPFDALGPVLGPAARAIADSVQAPDALAGGGVLAAAAVAAQAHANVVMPHGQEVPVSLYVAGAADSGARKSAVDAVTCQPIDEQRKRDARAQAQAMAAFKAARAKRKPSDDAEEPPTAKTLTIGKATTEGLHKLLMTQPHIGLFSPEGAEFVGGHSMRDEKRAAGIAWLLKAWGGETLDSMTRGDGLSVLVGRRVSMHVLMQPVILRTLLADPLAQGQGWIARTLIAAPRSLAGTRLFRAGQIAASKLPAVLTYYAALRALLDMPLPLHTDGDGYELKPRSMSLDSGATAIWIEFYDEVERQQADGAPLAGVRAWASKAAEHAARIAAVITLMEDAAAAEVPRAAMEDAVTVAAFYLSEHVRLMGQSVEMLHLQRLRDLLAWLRGRGPRVKHADVLQLLPRDLRDLRAEGINPLLGELERRAYIRRSGDAWEVRRA